MRSAWKTAKTYSDIRYHKAAGIAKITINRPEKRNAFRPETVAQMLDAFADAREDQSIGVILLTGAGPHKDGKYAFCSGGDQSVRGTGGYVGGDGVPRLNVLDLQRVIRSIPKVVIALVAGYAIGGGHVLHLVCDLTLAADNAVFGQVGPRMGSFDGGFGSSYLARIVGQKRPGRSGFCAGSTTPGRLSTWGSSTRSCPWRPSKRRAWPGRGKSWATAPGDPVPEERLQRGARRTGRHPGAGRKRHDALLHDGGGKGAAQGPTGQAEAGSLRNRWLP